MKIVQSLWSKPGNPEFIGGIENHNKCGWADKRFNYFSWALSVNQLLKYYNQVELITDKKGYDLLINRLELPYTSVRVVLDNLNGYHHKLWALGKLYAYSLQEEPFMHVDGDVYIWEKFDDSLENGELLCQNREEGNFYNAYYRQIFLPIASNFNYYPKSIDNSLGKHQKFKAINAGVMGGQNLVFFKEYTAKAFEFVDRNMEFIEETSSAFNMIYEQLLFRSMADEQGIDISYFYSDTAPPYFFDFMGIPNHTKYIHVSGSSKKESFLTECLEYRLRRDYPEFYYRILRLLKKNII